MRLPLAGTVHRSDAVPVLRGAAWYEMVYKSWASIWAVLAAIGGVQCVVLPIYSQRLGASSVWSTG